MNRPSIGLWTKEWALRRGIPVVWQAEVGSTNDQAKADFSRSDGLLAGAAAVPLALYLADAQSAGRGRGGSRWLQARPGTALLSTWSWAMRAPPQPIYSPLVGLALFRAACGSFPALGFALKAPNDLYLDERKVAGVLIEAVDAGRARRAAVGIGLNALEAPSLLEPEGPKAGGPKTDPIALAAAGATIDQASWELFLHRLRDELARATEAGVEQTLHPAAQAELREALNRNPRLPSRVLEVDSKGQLTLADGGVVRWQDL